MEMCHFVLHCHVLRLELLSVCLLHFSYVNVNVNVNATQHLHNFQPPYSKLLEFCGYYTVLFYVKSSDCTTLNGFR